jgi:hypothetical protein
MLRFVCIVALLFASASCKRDGPYSISGIEGQTLEEVINKYGKPEYEHSFQLTDTVLEYRQGLLEKFKRGDELENLIIKEVKFYASKEEIFIWFHQKDETSTWKVIGSLVVANNVKI